MSKRVAIVQSNYIPWKGYFDLIGQVDEFILLDDAQYTRRDWRNRNIIKTAAGPHWLTIPVSVRGRYHQRIDETEIADPGWGAKHWTTMRQAYARAPAFEWAREALEPVYLGTLSTRLSEVNRQLLEVICSMLGISTPLKWSTDYDVSGASSERLLGLCVQAGATEYLSGPAARDYLDESLFEAQGIAVSWMDYQGYSEYPQLHPPFDHHVSAVDLLFNAGPDARGLLERAVVLR